MECVFHEGVLIDAATSTVIDATTHRTVSFDSVASLMKMKLDIADQKMAYLVKHDFVRLRPSMTERLTIYLLTFVRRDLSFYRELREHSHRRTTVQAGFGGAAAAAFTVAFAPAIRIAGLLFLVSVIAGTAAGDLASALHAAALGAFANYVGLFMHEGAHLLCMRGTNKSPDIGAFASSGMRMWVVGPPMDGWRSLVVAAAGPFVAIIAVLLLGVFPPFDSQRWIVQAIAIVHACNFTTAAEDGRTIWTEAGRLISRYRRVDQDSRQATTDSHN